VNTKARKSQAGLEYILIFAFLLAILTPIFIYAISISSISMRTTQSRTAVQTIATAANNLYKLGGGKTTIAVNIPSGVESYLVENKTIKLRLRIGDDYGDAFAVTDANVTGQIPITEGVHNIPVEMLSDGTIQIG
jgi:hypothetical protein